MAFDIKIQQTLSPENQLTKTITDIATLSGTLREETTIIDPVITIRASNFSDLMSANYMTIPVFNRSYFIKDIKLVRNEIYEIHAHVDVLGSFAAAIRANSAIVRRNENANNILLNDGVFKIKQNPHIVVVEFPSGFSANEFVFAVAGS